MGILHLQCSNTSGQWFKGIFLGALQINLVNSSYDCFISDYVTKRGIHSFLVFKLKIYPSSLLCLPPGTKKKGKQTEIEQTPSFT